MEKMLNTKRYFIISLLALLVSTPYVAASTLCIKEEREALLKIKKDLKDPLNCLSSWVGNDCCNWNGIECHNQTGYILKLDLGLDLCPFTTNILPPSSIGGEINPSITGLKHLRYLDLSFNNFEGIPIPKFIGSLNKLRYLYLLDANFSGMVPTHLGNLSNLQHLAISSSFDSLWVRDVSWLSALSSLQYLYMQSVNITSTSHELFRAVNMMSSLLELRLISCNLRTLPPSLQLENITSLSVLHLSGNPFNSSIPSSLFNMSSLTELVLSSSSLRGPLPMLQGGNLCKLRIMDLSFNYLTGHITQMLDTLSSCSNHVIGKLSHSIGKFNSLFELVLSFNSFSGPMPVSIGNLSNLALLDMQGNTMNEEIPESIGQLTQLSYLNLYQNNWEGTITNNHFHNLTNLASFYISSKPNSFVFKVTQEWIPPFKYLNHVEIRDCQVGPTFPSWLRNLTFLKGVFLENVGISGEIPHWFYNLSSQIWALDLSQNKLNGYLPKIFNFSNSPRINLAFNQLKGSVPLWYGVDALDLSNNLLSGTLPTNISKEMSHLTFLDISNNHLYGSIPLAIYKIQYLSYIALSNNYLNGSIPMFWMGMGELRIIDLSNNSLSGEIPASICSPSSLVILKLSNNNLSANLSSTFQNCTSLQTLLLGNNRFYGSMPKEISKNLPFLEDLLLRGNTLTGSIPEEVCGLHFLHFLDLAENNLSGSIPTCLGDVQGFKLPQTYLTRATVNSSLLYSTHVELMVKGRITEYENGMFVHSTIDLSNNDLCGKIPEKLTELIHLGILNLSWNRLTGNIPSTIGSLKDLESLDLSHNHLSGPIPASMASMTFLSNLNLSYNNLSGQIPSGNQFDTFNDPSIYEGNPKLCGKPLPTNCSSALPGNEEKGGKHEDGADEKIERLWLYASIAFGYITSFWLVCGSLMLKRSWRHAYFNFAFDMRDKLLVLIAVNLAPVKREFGLERN